MTCDALKTLERATLAKYQYEKKQRVIGRKMKGYKIVLNVEGRLYSATRLLGQIEYGKGIKSVPHENSGPICVFSNKKYIQSLLRMIHSARYPRETWKCIYEPSEETTVWNSHVDIDKVPISDLSLGTKLANWVKLIEKI